MTCIIVRHEAYEQYDHLQASFGHMVPVIWDRRRARRRPLADADTAPSARNSNRRRKPPVSWTTLGFVVVDRPAVWARDAVTADSAAALTGPQWSYQFYE